MNNEELGKNLRTFRQDKHMNLKEVALQSGISISMLSQIERGTVNPSLNTLKQISQTLDIPLYYLFMFNEEKKPPIVRQGERKTLGFQQDEAVTYELLTPDNSGTIEFFLMKVKAHSETGKHSVSHSTEEVAYVIQGQVIVQLDDENFTLYAGDSVRIKPFTIHKWMNDTDDPVIVIFAISPPSF